MGSRINNNRIASQDLLDEIARSIREKDEVIHRLDIPLKVKKVIEILDEVEYTIRPTKQHYKTLRSNIPDTASGLVKEYKYVHGVIRSIESYLCPDPQDSLPWDEILSEIKSRCSSRDGLIQQKRKYFDILNRIAREIRPLGLEKADYDGLPEEVATIVNGKSVNPGRIAAEVGSTDEPPRSYTIKEYEEERLRLKAIIDAKNTVIARQIDEIADEQSKWSKLLHETSQEAEESRNKLIEECGINLAELKSNHARFIESLNYDHQTQLESVKSEVSDKSRKLGDLKREYEIVKLNLTQSLTDYSESKRKYENLHDNHQTSLEKIQTLENTYQTESADWSQKAQQLNDQIERLGNQIQQLTQSHENELSDLSRSHTQKVVVLEDSHAQKMQESQNKLTRYFKKDKDTLKAKHDSDIGNLHSGYKKQITELSSQYSATIADLKKEIDDLHIGYEKQMEDQKSQFDRKTQDMASDYQSLENLLATEQAKSKAALKDAKSVYETDVLSLRTKYSKDQEILVQKYILKMEHMKNAYDQRIEERKREVDILSERLYKRDESGGMQDSEILNGKKEEGQPLVVGFATINSKIQSFAAWGWRENRKVWSEDILKQIAGSQQRLLRKHILGDLIWTILYNEIFCSPFRLLGDIGKKPEEDWNGKYGCGDSEQVGPYKWPSPTLESEKFRYDACQGALDALTKPTTELSQGGQVKKSFFKHHKQLRENIMNEIKTLVELDSRKESDLDKFLLDIVRMWLLFCSQRYRIRMILPGSIEKDQMVKMEQGIQNELKLTVTPRLQRWGNARGVELQQMSLISGFEGRSTSPKDT